MAYFEQASCDLAPFDAYYWRIDIVDWHTHSVAAAAVAAEVVVVVAAAVGDDVVVAAAAGIAAEADAGVEGG